jgi:peptidyl-prolyl cis-trans isomerase D
VNFLKTGPFAEYLFPGGKYVGDDGYINFIQMLAGQDETRTDFETQVKEDLELQRLQALITGGVTVSDAAVREAYLQQGTKVKFDYAVVSLDDIKKSINPSDADLQAFFKQNAARYANAIPETRKIEYVAFDAAKVPGGKPQVTDAEVQAYYTAHQAEYKTDEAGEDAAHPDQRQGGRGCADGCGGEGQGAGRAESTEGGRELCRPGEEVFG